jgi:hypothetical protein
MRSKVGWVLSVLPSLLLLFSGFNKVMASEEVLSGLNQFGIDPGQIKVLGIAEILLTLLYLIPRTSFVGAILLTGWIGGAIFTHLRVGDGFVMQIIMGVLIWVGFSLRYYDDILPLLGLRRPIR